MFCILFKKEPDDYANTASQLFINKSFRQSKKLEAAVFRFLKQQLTQSEPSLFIIEGDAGSGKSVVLNDLFTKLQQKSRQEPTSVFYQTQNTLLVNHNEMLKIYKELAGAEPALLKKDFQKPTPFINHQQKQQTKADIVFVDEGHLLLTSADPYNRFTGKNQLIELFRCTKIIVLVFDPHQVIKLKSYWTTTALKALTAPYITEVFHLEQQYRVESPSVTNWINAFTRGKLSPLPTDPNFDFQVFADGIPLYEKIQQQNQRAGLARLIATADFPFTVMDEKVWYVTAGNLKLPWDKINFTDRPWAERPETLHEVGSIYTIQGFDLNYAGVILGPSIKYDPQKKRVYADPAYYEDHEAFKKQAGFSDAETAKAKAEIVMNSVNILLKRGKKGLYLYAVDQVLRQALLKASSAN